MVVLRLGGAKGMVIDMAKNTENVQYAALERELSAGEIGPLYLFWGEESYLREHWVGVIRKHLLPEGMADFNHKLFEGKDIDMDEVRTAVDTVPFFSDRTLVELRGLDIFSNEPLRSAMAEIVSDVPDYCCLLVVFDLPDMKPKATTALYKEISKLGKVVEFTAQSQSKLVNWIIRRFTALGCNISHEDADYMIFYCGSLMTGLILEVDKLAAYCGPRRVTRADIEEVAIAVPTAIVYRMTDALSSGEHGRAAEIMAELIAMRESPIMLLSLIARQFRQLYTACLALRQGRGAEYVKELWGMRSDYPARLLINNAKLFSREKLENILKLCAKTDFEMKSNGSDNEGLLCSLFLNIAGTPS